MRKLNLILLAFVILIISGLILSVSIANAEEPKPADTKITKEQVKVYNPCKDPNCGTDKPCICGGACQCPAMKMAKGNKDADKTMGMDQGMMNPMMKMGDDGGKGACGCMMGMSGGKMGRGQGMMCPMMHKKMEGGTPMMEPGIDQIMANADKLQLTKDQRDKLDNMVLTHKKDMIKKKADLDVASVELEGLMKKETPDLKAIADQFKKHAGLEADLRYSEFEFNVNIKALLTNEQKDTLKMIMKHNDQMGTKMEKDMQISKPKEPAPKPTPNPHEGHK